MEVEFPGVTKQKSCGISMDTGLFDTVLRNFKE